MKILVQNYTFSPSTKQVTLTDYTSVDLKALLLITNVMPNTIIYNFAAANLGGTVSGNVITLDYNTVGMSSSDILQIYYDDPAIVPATNDNLTILQDQNVLLRRLVKQTETLATMDTNQRQLIKLDVVTAGAIRGDTTLAAPMFVRLSEGTGNLNVYGMTGASFSLLYAIPDVWRTVDTARLTYAHGIRSNLTFS
jgi:hypothetical protein